MRAETSSSPHWVGAHQHFTLNMKSVINTADRELRQKYPPVACAWGCVLRASCHHRDDVVTGVGWREAAHGICIKHAQGGKARQRAGADDTPRSMTADVNCRVSQLPKAWQRRDTNVESSQWTLRHD